MNYGDEQSTGAVTGDGSQTEIQVDNPNKMDMNGTPNHHATIGSLVPGTQLDSYVIERVLRASANEALYLARVQPEGSAAGETAPAEEAAGPAFVSLTERKSGAFEAITPIVSAGLRHPRILLPWAILSRDGLDYLVAESLAGENHAQAKTVAEGARLEPELALTAVAGLADALSYLHRNGVVHLHISPDMIAVENGRAYLTGMEQAEYVGVMGPENPTLFARDANFLARTLGVLADANQPSTGSEDSNVRAMVRQIVARGEAGEFTAPEEVAGACATGLQTGPILPNEQPPTSHGRIALEVGSSSSVGRVRSENQDACAVVIFDVRDDSSESLPLGVFLVADGMGGEARGELASRIGARIVVAEMARHFALPVVAMPALAAVDEDVVTAPTELPENRVGRALTRAVDAANRQIRGLARRLGQTTGTTMTAIAVCGIRAGLAHVGDSRAYLLRGDALVQLTEDHSVLARLQAMDHPLLSDPDVFVPRSMLYRSLGQDDDASPDAFDFTLAGGDRLLICSDGLWDELDAEVIGEALAGAADPQSCAERLVALANEAGGHDNSTAVVLFVHNAPEDMVEREAADAEARDEELVGGAAVPDDAPTPEEP